MKSRLVVRGFTQQYGIDYEETFASVAKIATIRLVLVVVAHLGLELEQMNVMTAFLCGTLQERIIMKSSSEYLLEADKFCFLLKTLYELKQSLRE